MLRGSGPALASFPGLRPDFLHGCEIISGRRPGNEASPAHGTGNLLRPSTDQSCMTFCVLD